MARIKSTMLCFVCRKCFPKTELFHSKFGPVCEKCFNKRFIGNKKRRLGFIKQNKFGPRKARCFSGVRNRELIPTSEKGRQGGILLMEKFPQAKKGVDF